MNDQFYKDEPVFKIRPTHIKKQLKPPFVREFGFYSPYLLNKEPVPSGREGYYLYYYMESYQTSQTVKKGKKYIKTYVRHTSKQSVEVTLEQWNSLHEKDRKDFNVNRFEYQQTEYDPRKNGRHVSIFDVMLQEWDKFDHEQFWVNSFDLERVLNTFSNEDLDIYLYAKEKHLKQKQIAILIGKSESYVTRRMKFIEDEIERDMLDYGEYTKREIEARLEYKKFMRTGKAESFIDVFVYDFLLSMPQEMQLRYLYIFRGQEHLIKFCFLWLYMYNTEKERPKQIAREVLNKPSYQLYKKHAVKLKTWAKQLFIAVEIEAERMIKQYGIKDSKPNEKFIKAVQKAAAAKGMTVAEYRDKILFSHGREHIIARYQLFIKKFSNIAGTSNPPAKDNSSAITLRNFVNRKRR